MDYSTATYENKYNVDEIDIWHRSCSVEQEAG